MRCFDAPMDYKMTMSPEHLEEPALAKHLRNAFIHVP